jgi:DNA-binding LacI/PurR family transcriptional regulator
MAGVPTQEEVARRAGVSRGLVSLALSDSPRVAASTKARIQSAAADLGYVRHLGAATLAAGTFPILAVLLPDLRNPFFEVVVEGLQRAAAPANLLALTATGGGGDAGEELAFQRLRELRPAGLVVVSPEADVVTLRTWADALPLVVIGWAGVGGSADSVHVDELSAAQLVVDHVSDRGYGEAILLTPQEPTADQSVRARSAAQLRAARGGGLKAMVVDSVAAAAVAARRAVDQGRRAAVLAHNDLLALDAVAACRALGLTPGRDVGVIGFDNTYLAERPEFDLTTVDQGATRLGAIAVDLIQDRQAGSAQAGRDRRLEPRLVIRSSS